MTTGIVNGTDLLLYVGGTAVAHSKSHTLSVSHEPRDATTKDSNGWDESLEGMRSWSIDGEALQAFDANYGHSDLLALITTRTKVTVKFSTEVTGDSYWTGEAWLTACELEAGTEESASYSFSFKGTGALSENTVT